MPVFSIQKWMFVTEKKRSDLQGFRFNHYTVDVWIYFYSGASEFASHGYLDLFSDCMYNMQICKGYKFKTKKKNKKKSLRQLRRWDQLLTLIHHISHLLSLYIVFF